MEASITANVSHTSAGSYMANNKALTTVKYEGVRNKIMRILNIVNTHSGQQCRFFQFIFKLFDPATAPTQINNIFSF